MQANGVKTEDIYKDVLHSLEVDKVFLNPSLSLMKFSVIVGTNTTYLSNVVNEHWGCNLRALVNRYRIEYAKQLLESGECGVNDIPKKSGFASRSAFYSAFQKEEGVPPISYLTKKRRLAAEDEFIWSEKWPLSGDMPGKGNF